MKKMQELTIKDSFMFAAVMSDPAQCRRFLSMVLEKEILSVRVITEKTMGYQAQYHGVRLDVLAEEDGTRRRFNVEMQVREEKLPKRSRYYHSQIDMDLLLAGEAYEKLPDVYVIFICDFDPIGKKKYRYTMKNTCQETKDVIGDGSVTVWLSSKGENEKEVPEEMVRFLRYVGNPEQPDVGGQDETGDKDFTARVKRQIEEIKKSREWRSRYMLLKEMLEEEREQGREEGRNRAKKEYILAILEKKGEVSSKLHQRIEAEADGDVLDAWFSWSLSVNSVEEFEAKLSE